MKVHNLRPVVDNYHDEDSNSDDQSRDAVGSDRPTGNFAMADEMEDSPHGISFPANGLFSVSTAPILYSENHHRAGNTRGVNARRSKAKTGRGAAAPAQAKSRRQARP